MSENEKKYRLGNGLPRCIGSGVDGFERLKSMLGLNRERCKALLEEEPVRKQTRALRKKFSRRKHLRPGERDRLLLFALYNDPQTRCIFWKLSYNQVHGDDTGSRTNSLPFPSLEQNILTNYILDTVSTVDDTSRIDEAFGEWPDLVQYLKDRDKVPWAGVAARAWSDVRKDLDSWGALEDGQRRQTALTAFAVATIVDDERVLRLAVEKVLELNTEFSDVLNEEDEDSETVDYSGKEEEDDVLTRWDELCESLQALAVRAGGTPPVVDALDEIAQVVKNLKSIAPSVQGHLEKSSFENLMLHLKGLLGKLEADNVFSWLDNSLREQLDARWQKEKQSLSPVQVREEFDRLDKKFPDAVKEVRTIAADLSGATHQIDSLRAAEPADFFARHSWEEKLDELEAQIHSLRQKQRQAKVALLGLLSPLGKAFDPSPDDSGSRPIKTEAAGESPISTTSANDENQLTEQAAGIEVSDVPGTATGDAGPIDQKPSREERHTEPSDASEDKPSIPHTSSPPSETEDPEPESDTAADSLAARARTQMAKALLESPPRIAYTVQVGRLLDRLEIPNANQPPVALFEAALLSDRLCLPDGNVANALRQVLERFPPPEQFAEGPDRDLYVLLAVAGALRPVLLVPQSGAWALLTALKPSERLEAVYRFASGIAKKSQKLQSVRIDSTVLRGAGSEAFWEKERQELNLEASNWLELARHRTIKYAPATNVWQWWLKRGGSINQLMALIISGGNDGDTSTKIKAILAELEGRKAFEDLVKETDRNEIRRRRGQDIHAGALNQLHEYAQEAVAFGRRHLSLNNSKPSQSDFLGRALAKLRDEIERLAPPALEQLGRFADGQKPLFAGAAHAAVHAIERFREFFNPESMRLDREPDPRELIASGLFGFPSLHIAADGTPEEAPRPALNTLLSDQPKAFESVFDQHLKAGDLRAAKRIVDWIEYEELDDADALRNRLDEAFRSETQKFRDQMADARTRVEIALARGHITDTARAGHDAILVELERRLAEPRAFRFDSERAKLNRVLNEIEHDLMVKKEKAEAVLADLALPSGSTEQQEISRSIEQGDIITADELIERIRSTGSLPIPEVQPSKKRNIFEEFYPSRSREIENALEELGNSKQVLVQIERNSEFAGMKLSNVPGAQRESAKQMLEAWFTLKRAGRINNQTEENIKTLFSGLGFIVRNVTITRRPDRNFGEARIETDLINARERCPIPAFGSFAKGQYRLVFLWGRPTEEDILQHADEHSWTRSTIVLYFGRLSDARREAFSHMARERSRILLVLDEMLLVFLCGERGSRMPILFACAIPFTYVQPYVTTAGLVPPEMFYGREQELREIAHPFGPVFIYGGRQLGKTALLRSVERTSHRPKAGSHAVWIDLKGEGIGYDRDAADIWPAIWRALRGISAIPHEIREPNSNKRINDFIDDLCSRFNNISGHTLLLLLDEADRFLEVDARNSDTAASGYRESSRLKALMDRTGRSIKVVFAGLHNVLRTAEGANHPLGHFGDPIEVGPLNWQTAEALVRQPLLASGYRFKHDGLVTRILAQTNYYPSLIQLYGSALIKAMCSRRISGAPLYDIDEAVLDTTYQNTNLREMIRSRFHLTLQLDSRYEVIAYSIAHECVEREGLLEEGIGHRRIDDAVRDWWPQGFEDIEPYTDGFRSLLDEMVGLGVLRRIDGQEGDRYTLRNANVLLLMGTNEEIADNLLRNREPPQEFEREFFRARHPKKSDGPFRCPLTFQQEDLLRAERNGVSVVCGVEVAGFGDVLPFLKARGANDSVVELGVLTNQQDFEKELHSRHSQRVEGTTICVVSDSVPWSEKWVRVALEQIGRLSAKGRYMQIVFMTNTKHLWPLLSELEELNRMGLQWISARPWRKGFLRQWMADVGFSNDPDLCQRIAERTGGWEGMLKRFYDSHENTGDLEASLDRLENEFYGEKGLQLLKQFGLDDPHVQKALGALAKLGEAVSFEHLKEFVGEDGIDGGTLQKRLEWAEMLHLVRRKGPNIWQMDAIAARVLKLAGG